MIEGGIAELEVAVDVDRATSRLSERTSTIGGNK
jgi:hypothetical protein